ncbi:MAG: Mut7-C RNAse domain-containing protein [Deferrisomatales bacterium]|nr:Mut7-C RNAse domain-containing protein [Deferrisomatales bacterium]
MLHARGVTHGCHLHSQHPTEQVGQVLRRFDLYRNIQPFTRCLTCNGCLEDVSKAEILHRLEPKTRLYYDAFRRCVECGQIYWKGIHFTGREEQVRKLRGSGE